MADLFAIYIHWPFCKKKCPYCDFNSHVSDDIEHEAWAEAYIKEIDYIAQKTKDRQVTSIFFGGGTPSLMEPKTVERVIDHIQKTWHTANNIEITLEANPTSIEAKKFEAFKQAGINRVSIGVQSLRNSDLKFLGREHSAAEAINAVALANTIFDRVSFDLMYARPNQTIQSWEEELNEVLTYASGHLSLYQLTIEQGTPFYTQHARGDFRIPEPDQAGDFYEVTQQILRTENMPAYEVSNHAITGQESIHNLAYWQYADYVGVGPGAHGRLTLDHQKFATRTHRAPEIWLDKVLKKGHGYHNFEEILTRECFTEMMMMGLRLKQGIEIQNIEKITGKNWQEVLRMDKLESLQNEGYLTLSKTHIKPTQDGMQRLNSLLSFLLV